MLLEDNGRTFRPFLVASGITPRSCSTPLQRRIVDFAADVPFHDVPKKLKEHYGVEICVEVVRQVTLDHASAMTGFGDAKQIMPDQGGVPQLIAEADGGMVPIVEIDNQAKGDKRKTRKVLWKEARLCFSRNTQKIAGIFRATFKSTDGLGDLWFLSALAAGMGPKTAIHCLGDGAIWIKEQMERIFGGQAHYLTDFYHVSEYLAAAGADCSSDAKKWLKEQQTYLREGNLYLVLQELEKHLYGKEPPKESVQACYRYLTNRLTQLDYLGAILEGLPIGSGEIESGHRHIIQKRMKRAGSWWKEENAELMLQLLTLRANGLWENYWARLRTDALEAVA